jgi:hypothetical protein
MAQKSDNLVRTTAIVIVSFKESLPWGMNQECMVGASHKQKQYKGITLHLSARI